MHLQRLGTACLSLTLFWTLSGFAGDEFERPPIEYSKSTPSNVVAALQLRLSQGEATLKYEDPFGYLPALLKALDVPVESQMLVFSKTSLQARRISPATPRAIYFSDDVYVGYCQSGDVIEISAVDPDLGAVFYTLDQSKNRPLQFRRQTDNCLVCHSSSRTDGVPGHVVRSVFVDPSGQPILSAGSKTVDYRTPLKDRWGGWYVTGTHGDQTHQGNLVLASRDASEVGVDNSQGMNVPDLVNRIMVDRYLEPGSDIVALMVLEHQVAVQNKITKANFTARQAMHYETDVLRALGEPSGERLESTTRRIESAGEELVQALLFCEEASLSDPIQGTKEFSEMFRQRGPTDSRGRSLRDFDLTKRLFRYPCSYLVYSEAFDGLPTVVRDFVWKRLREILAEGESSDAYRHLSAEDRRSILEILMETKPELATIWPSSVSILKP